MVALVADGTVVIDVILLLYSACGLFVVIGQSVHPKIGTCTVGCCLKFLKIRIETKTKVAATTPIAVAVDQKRF